MVVNYERTLVELLCNVEDLVDECDEAPGSEKYQAISSDIRCT